MSKESLTVFYAWQSDRPAEVNCDLIERATRAAIDRVKADLRMDIQLDRDTQGVPGMPGIGDTILRKIRICSAFLADVTLVGESGRDCGSAKKLMPNSNVMIEVGYAASELGWERMVGVMNTAYGGPEQLPLDVRDRHLVVYDLREGTDEAGCLGKLTEEIAEKLRKILDPVVGQADAKRREAEKAAAERAAKIREEFEDRVRRGEFHRLGADRGIVAVSIVPDTEGRVDLDKKRRDKTSIPVLIGQQYANREDSSRALVAFTGNDSVRLDVTELNERGHVLCASTPLIRSGETEVAGVTLPPSSRGWVAAEALVNHVIPFVHRCLSLMHDVGVSGAIRVGVSLLNVKDHVFWLGTYADVHRHPAGCLMAKDDRIRSDLVAIVNWSGSSAQDVRRALKPAFDAISQDFGYDACHNYDSWQ